MPAFGAGKARYVVPVVLICISTITICYFYTLDYDISYKLQGKKLHIRHISDECRSLLRKADKFVEINVSEDPRYRVATDKLA